MDAGAIMAVDGLKGLSGLSPSKTLANPKKLQTLDGYADSILIKNTDDDVRSGSFDSLLKSAMTMIEETNRYTNEASEAELSYAMGLTNSTHDLQVAQMKANISLQYTVAVRNAVIDAYKEIMQLQF